MVVFFDNLGGYNGVITLVSVCGVWGMMGGHKQPRRIFGLLAQLIAKWAVVFFPHLSAMA